MGGNFFCGTAGQDSFKIRNTKRSCATPLLLFIVYQKKTFRKRLNNHFAFNKNIQIENV